ncbi:MAG: hypothetical protein QM800_06745 [Paludibacter sp.]
MNLRFAAHSLRIRVSADEFAQLQAGKSLGLEVPLPRGHVFRAKVNSGSTGDWLFDSDPTGLWLTVPRVELEQLGQALPSREGVMHGFATHHGELQVSLEVDVKPR